MKMIKVILAVTFFIGAIFTGFYFVYPKYEKYQEEERSNEILEQELKNTIDYLREIQEADRKITEKEEELKKLKTAFPEDHDAPSLYFYLMNQFKKHNLKSESSLGDFSVSPYRIDNQDHERIRKVSFSIALEGKYSDIKNFLKDTERLIRIISIDNFSIDGQKDERRDYIQIQLNAITYSY